MSIDQQNDLRRKTYAQAPNRRPFNGFFVTYPQCMNLPLDSEKEDSFARADSPELCDLLDAVAEEIEVDWPEFLPVERIAPGIMKIALGSLLFVGLAAFCVYHLKARLADSLGKEHKPTARVLVERLPGRSNADYHAW